MTDTEKAIEFFNEQGQRNIWNRDRVWTDCEISNLMKNVNALLTALKSQQKSCETTGKTYCILFCEEREENTRLREQLAAMKAPPQHIDTSKGGRA